MNDTRREGNRSDASRQQPADGSPPDHDLIRRMVSGDPEALRLLMRRYDRLVRYAVYRTARKHCLRDPDWLDARASEVWTGFVQSMQRRNAKPPQDLAAYFLQIARRKCVDAIRVADAIAERTLPSGHPQDLQALAEQENTAEIVAGLEEMENLRSCMGLLSAEDQAICGQYELIVERRWTQAAQVLGIAESTLRSRWATIVGRLRVCLEKKGQKRPENLAPEQGFRDS